jgi:hypothetical protein
MITAVHRHHGSKRREHEFVDTLVLAMALTAAEQHLQMGTSSRQQSSGLQRIVSNWRFEAWAPKDAPAIVFNIFEFAIAIEAGRRSCFSALIGPCHMMHKRR